MARLINMHRTSLATWKGLISVRSMVTCPRVVLGIETSCDDTGAAVVDEHGNILGEALLSQKDVHLKTGGIIPSVAQQLHRDNIDRVVNEAIVSSGISASKLSAIATTVKPGLALSLGVGLIYSLNLVKQYNKPFIPIHHMEAHALTVRLLHPVEFPFLVLLISGGHCLLAVANGVSDFLLLGQSIDEAPGDSLDKVARRLSLIKHPDCSSMSGGQAIEHLSQFGDKTFCREIQPKSRHRDCNFSFAGLRSHYNYIIQKMEAVEGLEQGAILSCAADIAASFQHAVAYHIIKRTQRAILFCKQENLLPVNASLVVSGGVASNGYIRHMLQNLTDGMDMSLLCPPPHLCTDNGIMIAWNGIERLRAGAGILNDTFEFRYEPRAPLGTDISEQVRSAAIKVPSLKIKNTLSKQGG
ncbi:PREDICTED: probable tRNA N6-adenosine threonylcarbamoyltransferase, mitochondrial [Nanorana parkeri]|uniref:probable tRNA N6-adenosine threonylcarbamoyltransferase, mitochondrial n=1 Tax=Nanorana parkeri TaxID=125878 RepID=UPI000854AFD1|nr:PREDICTED: probable tRNA N6-adenosine threonylcarbamoyltransferase, mitochondrial [Nanorana parkeri]